MNALRMDELEALARSYIDGEVNRVGLFGLPIFDMWYVLTLAGVYSCTKVGTISERECVRFKYKVAADYKHYMTVTDHIQAAYDTWVENTAKYSSVSCEVSRELAKDKPDAVKFIGGLCVLLDVLTKENVWHKLFVKRIEDEDFKKSCIDAVMEHGEEWREKFKNIRDEDYVVLLEKFYAATDENGMAKRFAALDEDRIKKAVLSVPVKDDDTRGIARGIRQMYGEQRVS